jgi:hypothetical protein
MGTVCSLANGLVEGDCKDNGDTGPCIPGAPCLSDMDCPSGDTCQEYCQKNFGVPCVLQLGATVPRCAVVDVDDILKVLDAFAGSPACPAACPAGACTGLPLVCDVDGTTCSPEGSSCADGKGTCTSCRDRTTPPEGMSECRCFELGGTWQGVGSTCP